MKALFCSAVIIAAACFAGGCGRHASSDGEVRMVVGEAWILSGREKRAAKVGDLLRQGDTVETGAASVVVAEISGGSAQVEIQEKALFRLESVTGDDKVVAIEKGNLWFLVKKVGKNGSYRLKTPTAIAAIRGTKMYRFALNGYDGMCHCEGVVEYTSGGSYDKMHSRDHMAFTGDGKTILLSPEDISFMIKAGTPHRHSAIDNSPLGGKASDMAEKQGSMLAKLVKERMGK